MRLNSNYKIELDAFINACMNFDLKKAKYELVTIFEQNNSNLIEENDPFNRLDLRLEEIFNSFKGVKVDVSYFWKNCGCSLNIDKTLVFNVKCLDSTLSETQFGFHFYKKSNQKIVISECSRSKSYQESLDKRLFDGKTNTEINDIKIAIDILPNL